VRGIPNSATLLALERDEALVIGAVSAPALGQRWAAAAGHGAVVRADGRERQIGVSSVTRLEEAQLCYASVRSAETAGLLPGLQRLVRSSWRDRGFGDFWAHMLVAQGSAEAMFEHGVKSWDLAAPYLIVAEAGGRMTDLEGRPSWFGPYAVTTNGLLHDTVLEALQG
jgi:histidinol-phosphatase